jgi:Class II flagellar assembly regulator
MKITEYSPVTKTSATTRKKELASSAGAGFLGLLSASEVEGAAPTNPMADVLPSSSMNALLSLQEMPDDELARRKAVQESRGTIEALETLRIGLLTGSIPEHLLQTLTNVVALQKQRVDDPRLMSLIEDIELRAAVELAKLERAARQTT